MTAKEYLRKYDREKREADAIEKRIEELRKRKTQLRAVCIKGMPKQVERRDLSNAEADIDDLVSSYIAAIQRYVGKEADIYERLAKMEEPEERAVLMYKYVTNRRTDGKRLTWFEIGDRMNCSARTAQRIHGMALLHFPMD